MNGFVDQFSQGLQWWAEFVSRLSIRRDRAPLDSVGRMFEFVSTRSALITQKKLYGYLKERIGLRYAAAMEDDPFARSVDIAKMEVFAASLSDMTIYAVVQIDRRAPLPDGERHALALACYASGMRDNAGEAPDRSAVARWTDEFRGRLEGVNWKNLAAGASPFTESPKALVRWAPIADEHKRYDREIVENSIRFAWNEVIQDYTRRLDAEAVIRDWEGREPA
ncbi:hypothetical protein ABUE31_19335 [Mesorhizobium sp. ZMM04-5]|uniref:Esterase n=1 Tax=Mesorhizobium marinum TaxID=3228790 RepID=A0ABV3R489_9HYPH